MSFRLGPKRVDAPDGVEWRISRRWLTYRPQFGRPRRGEIASESLLNAGPAWPDVGNVDLGEGMLLVAVAVAIALILIPVLFLGIELIVVGVLLASGVMARTIFRKPWVVEARSSDPLTSARLLEWQVRGWRKSGKLIGQVASELSAGREPLDAGLPE